LLLKDRNFVTDSFQYVCRGVGDVMNRFYPTIVKTLLQQRVQKVSCGSQFSICLTSM